MEKDIYRTYFGKAYRFVSFDTLFKTIENETLRFTRSDKFNDPLDCNPFLFQMDWEILKVADNNSINFVQDYMFQKALSSLYICCFCKEFDTDDSYLMWSHYGQSHSQVCFEIDFGVNKYLGAPSEVFYPDSLSEFRQELKSKTKAELGVSVLTTKLKQWGYEKEVRLIIDLKHQNSSSLKPTSDNSHLYAPFDLNNISKVVFGLRSERSNEKKTIRMFQEKGLQPIFQKMIISPNTLKLKVIEYEATFVK